MKNFLKITKQKITSDNNEEDSSEPATGSQHTNNEMDIYHIKRAKVIALSNTNCNFAL